MKIIINLSSIRAGGGLQVAQSLLDELVAIEEHDYYFFVPRNLFVKLALDKFPANFAFYQIHPPPSGIVAGRKSKAQIKKLEETIEPDVVFTLFGPSYWRPKTTHLCGYALPHFVYTQSPFFKIIQLKERLEWKLRGVIKLFFFKRDCDYYVTETEDVSARLANKLSVSKDKVFTVSNAYNGIFDTPQAWRKLTNQTPFPPGFKLVTISSANLHKNLNIIPKVVEYLNENHPAFDFTFILTVEPEKLPGLTEQQKKHILFLGKVHIEECPLLYQRVNALFMPTLLECFTVSYLEAMKMEKPILTSDLSFAHSICDDAASYFSPLDPGDIGEKIVQLASDKALEEDLIARGRRRLKKFDTAEARARKYVEILEFIGTEKSQ